MNQHDLDLAIEDPDDDVGALVHDRYRSFGFSQINEPSLRLSSLVPGASLVNVPCPIHEELHIPVELQPLLDTEAFQRLKFLKQLGACSWKFPSATHTRFQHSLGVAHLAYRFASALSQKVRESGQAFDVSQACATSDELLQVACAGLAHDLGHGPYSHLYERFCRECLGDPHWSHEEMSEKLLDKAVEEVLAHPMLTDRSRRFFSDTANMRNVKRMIRGVQRTQRLDDVEPEKMWLFEIVNNTSSGFDVDKLDYLQRDPQHIEKGAEASARAVNIELLLEHAMVVPVHGASERGPGDFTEVAFKKDQKAFGQVDTMFKCRAALHSNVYKHEQVLAAEEMLLMIMSTLADVPGFDFQGRRHDPGQYLALDDALIDRIQTVCLKDVAAPHRERVREAQRLHKLLTYRLGWTPAAKRTVTQHHARLHRPRIAKLVDQVLASVRRQVASAGSRFPPGLRLMTRLTLADEGKGEQKGVANVLFWHRRRSGAITAQHWTSHEHLEERAAPGGSPVSTQRQFCHLLYYQDADAAGRVDVDELEALFRATYDEVFRDAAAEGGPGRAAEPPAKRPRGVSTPGAAPLAGGQGAEGGRAGKPDEPLAALSDDLRTPSNDAQERDVVQATDDEDSD